MGGMTVSAILILVAMILSGILTFLVFRLRNSIVSRIKKNDSERPYNQREVARRLWAIDQRRGGLVRRLGEERSSDKAGLRLVESCADLCQCFITFHDMTGSQRWRVIHNVLIQCLLSDMEKRLEEISESIERKSE